MSDSILDSNKKTILVATDALFLKTGLSRNIKALLKEWYKSGKYNLVHFCSGTTVNDPRLNMFPWPCEGALKIDPESQHRYASDPHSARVASYGGDRIEELVKKYKPDIVFMQNDIWSFPCSHWSGTDWAKGVHMISFITIDSVPILNDVFDMHKNSHFYSWAKFGEDEMRKHYEKQGIAPKFPYGTINAAIDIEEHKPISKLEKMNLRKKFNIPQDAVIFNFVGRNQLRKKYDTLIKALASFRKQYPNIPAYHHYHTSWSEGWPLKRIIESQGLDPKYILTTYVCKKCKEFEIKPFAGEGQDCPYCGEKHCQDTASITNGVSDENMKYIYGLSDAAISVYTSGGMEMHCAESALNGLMLATVPYSCGLEYTENCKDIYPISFVESGEVSTGFTKSEPSIQSCVKFMKKVCDMKESARTEVGNRIREWAIEKFDSKKIAKKWMDIFDGFEKVDYKNVKFGDMKSPKPDFKPDFSLDGEAFIKHLYSGFLDAQHPDDDGMRHWLARLNENQEPKEQIAQIFQQIAAKDAQPKGVDIEDLLLKNDKKNLFFVLKESLGDCIISLSLLEGARLSYPNHNINIVTEPKFFEVFKGCEFVDNLIPHNPILEQEMYIIGAGQEDSIGDVFVMPAVATQKHLNYLSNNNPELLRNQWKTKDQMEELHKLGINCDINRNPIVDWTLQTK